MKPGPGAYAGVVSRGIAFAIDATIAGLVCTVGYQFAIALLATVGITPYSFGGTGKALGYVAALPITFATYCACAWALVGRTVGMTLMGLRVVRRDGSPPGVLRSIVRAVGYWVSAVLLLGFVWIALDERSQGFHDKLAGTFVVYDEAKVVATPRTA